MGGKSRQRQRGEAGRIPPWEWVVAVVGALVVAASIGFLVYEALTAGAGWPEIELEAIRVRPVAGGYLLELQAVNRGAAAAANLEIRARLGRDGRLLEEGRAVFDFVPGGARRRGGVFFSRDPRLHDLELDVEGYQEP